MSAAPPCLPPRRPLCRTCDDSGVIRVGATLNFDACPDCTRNAEMRWVGAHAARTAADSPRKEISHG